MLMSLTRNTNICITPLIIMVPSSDPVIFWECQEDYTLTAHLFCWWYQQWHQQYTAQLSADHCSRHISKDFLESLHLQCGKFDFVDNVVVRMLQPGNFLKVSNLR